MRGHTLFWINKNKIGLKEISFHGHVITKDGVKTDDKKVKAIYDKQPPIDVSGVKDCDMVEYMA